MGRRKRRKFREKQIAVNKTKKEEDRRAKREPGNERRREKRRERTGEVVGSVDRQRKEVPKICTNNDRGRKEGGESNREIKKGANGIGVENGRKM